MKCIALGFARKILFSFSTKTRAAEEKKCKKSKEKVQAEARKKSCRKNKAENRDCSDVLVFAWKFNEPEHKLQHKVLFILLHFTTSNPISRFSFLAFRRRFCTREIKAANLCSLHVYRISVPDQTGMETKTVAYAVEVAHERTNTQKISILLQPKLFS